MSSPVSSMSSPSRSQIVPLQRQPSSAPPPHATTSPSTGSWRTGTTGPSFKETALITSTWGIGWQTPALMFGPYFFALAIAITHLLIFRYLDGKEADGLNMLIPQTYVSTTSNVLANVFGFSLRAALAVAFVQYLWYLLRVETMKVSTIELLFSIRSNLFLIFQPAALRATPVLFTLALFMWLSQIVISLPPGALTIASVQRVTYGNILIPTFNASFMGNGSGLAANQYSLQELVPSITPTGFYIGSFKEGRNTNLIIRLARQVLNAGEALPMTTPCGTNCSYVVEFEGPWIECTNTMSSYFINSTSPPFDIYSGKWTDASVQARGPGQPYNGTYTLANFHATTLVPLEANYAVINNELNGSIFVQQTNVLCAPGRADFRVNNTYLNNVHSRSVTVKPTDKLINLALPGRDSVMKVPGIGAEVGNGFGSKPANWSSDALAYYRDQNLMTMFSAMFSWLNGSFGAYPMPIDEIVNVSAPITNLYWSEKTITSDDGLVIRNIGQNGTLIDSTRFNSAFGAYSISKMAPPSFNITQELLNDYLLNMTTSIMVAYDQWKTTANATRSTATNIYKFSQPLNLILPYFISLGLALPFILAGTLALLKNGVPATDGSFMQIIRPLQEAQFSTKQLLEGAWEEMKVPPRSSKT